MALQFEQIQRQTQQLIMTPQMKQAIQLLQLPLMELCNVIDQEMVSNPVLEEATDDKKTAQEQEEHTPEKSDNEELDFKEEFDRLAQIDDEWREYFRQSGSYRKYSQEDEERRQYLENSITRTETLQDHLLNQLSIMSQTDEEKEIGEQIIGNIDDNGYLQSSLEEIAIHSKVSLDKVEQVLELIQKFHPIGVGARNLKECLLIQLRRLGKEGTLAEKIVSKYLDDLAKKRYAQIAKALKTTIIHVQHEAELIASLEPKPGRMFVTDTTHYVLPDVVLEKIGDEYKIILNDDKIPHLRISPVYKTLMSKTDIDTNTKDYIKEKIKSGKWLLKNIHQRQQTIYNITNEIVQRQRRFFDEGIAYLQPMTMQVIANALGLHESTVSRAISGKYMQTPRGVFQLKYFFTTPISTKSGTATSATTVKDRIHEIIRNEDSKKPLSDSKIIDILKKEGVQLARRTVAKYRKELNILPANLRKKF
ncbi:MAG: RNA polymerase factor sigma-54 [Candidatus Auribacterota bacterium]|jgi:RNA polymerase sigma-54 factor|nr:RNA polymerase factor sigma-54 [Candidatus Auribacterota bacterium]